MGRFYDWTEDEKATYRADVEAALANNDLAELKIKKKSKRWRQASLSPAPSFNGDRKMMNELFGEFLGTLILILLGNGVVAGVVLPKPRATAQVGL